MITRPKLTVAQMAAAGLLVALAGCGKSPSEAAAGQQNPVAEVPQPPAVDPGNILFAGPSSVITDKACEGTQNPTSIIFTVKPNMLKTLGGTKQNIERKVDTVVNGVETAQPTPPAGVNKLYNPTYLDMGISAPDGMGTWTEVIIKLKNKNAEGIRFMPVRDANGIESPTDSSYAVLAEAGKAAQFCGRKTFEDDKKGNDMVRFGVKLAKPDTVSINIGLLIEDKKNPGYWIPVYLDPNIKNTG
jgi:hypothetical protein